MCVYLLKMQIQGFTADGVGVTGRDWFCPNPLGITENGSFPEAAREEPERWLWCD